MIMSVEKEQHEQIESVANHGSLCKRIKNEKENIINSAMWKRQGMPNGAFLKSFCINKKIYILGLCIMNVITVCQPFFLLFFL